MAVTRCMGCMKEYDDSFEICPHCGYAKDAVAKQEFYLVPGTILRGKYIVGKALGNGENGITYLGWDAVLNSKVVIKEYYPSDLANRIKSDSDVITYDGDRKRKYDNGLESFLKAGENLSKYNYIEGIVHIFDSFSENNTGYLVMEYLEGVRLYDMINQQGKKSYQDTITMFIPILKALSILHNNGIVHGDISPKNILITNNKVKLIDFNLELHTSSTNKKAIYTQGYSPSEMQRSNGKVGPWSDIYSIGATMYFCLTARRPENALQREDNDNLADISKYAPLTPPYGANAIMNTLNLNPVDRIQSASLLIDLLTGKRKIKRVKGKSISSDRKAKSTKKKVISIVTVIVCLLIAGIAVTFVMLNNASNDSIKSSSASDDEVKSISLYGKTVEEAEKELKAKNIELKVVGNYYDDGSLLNKLDEDSIIKPKDISSDSKIVKVKLYAGKKASTKADINNMVEVPNLKGREKSDAISTLEEYGLDYEIETKPNNTYVGSVFYQDTKSGSKVKVGTTISITVGVAPVVETTEPTTVPATTYSSVAKVYNNYSKKTTQKTTKATKKSTSSSSISETNEEEATLPSQS